MPGLSPDEEDHRDSYNQGVTAERERWRAASRALLEAMPRCSANGCVGVQTFGYGDGVGWCDQCASKVGRVIGDVTEYKRAAPMRALQAMVASSRLA